MIQKEAGRVKYGLLYYVDLILSKAKVVVYVPCNNSQGHIRTGPPHCHLWESNLHSGESL